MVVCMKRGADFHKAQLMPLQSPLVIKCFKYLLTKLSNNIDVSVIFRWSFTLAIFETIAETTQEILEN